MKIKLRCSLSGPRFVAQCGEETDALPDDDCRRLIEKGLATLVDDAPQTTSTSPTRTAARKPGKPRPARDAQRKPE